MQTDQPHRYQTSKPHMRSALPWFEELVVNSDRTEPNRVARYMNAVEKLASLGWQVSRSSSSMPSPM
jgi:hypothetical protein